MAKHAHKQHKQQQYQFAAKAKAQPAATQRDKLLTSVGAMPADTSGMHVLASAASIDRMLTRFGWLGESDEVLARVGISRPQLRALETDEEIYSSLETRRYAVTNTSWRFEHPQELAADFFNDAFKPHMDALLTALWSAIPYGYAVAEVVYTEPGDPTNATPGRYGIGKIHDVPFEWVRLLPGDVMVWRDNMTECDPRKFFACVQGKSLRKPSGEALLGKLYWPWFFRAHGWKMWAKHMERVAIPFLYGKTDGDKSEAVNALAGAVQDAVFVSGTRDELTALSMGSGGNTLFPDFETAVTRRIKMAILGQTLTSGTDGGSGNRALGNVHNEVRLEKKQSDVKLITQTVQRIADALAALNAMPAPLFVMEDGSGLEIERAGRDKILVDAGMVKFTPDYIKDKYDLLDTDFTVPVDVPANPAGQPQPSPLNPANPAEQAQNQPTAPAEQAQAAMNAAAPFKFVDGHNEHRPKFTAGQQAIEDQVDNTLANFISPITNKAIASAIAGATSPENLIERLGVAMQDSTDAQFRQTLERAMFAADLMGYGQSQTSHTSAPVQTAAAAHTINLSAPITIRMPEHAAPVVNMAAQPAPVVQVDVHAPPAAPMPAPVVNFAPIVRMPEQPAPVVNVLAPAVTITNDVKPAPVTVNNAFASRAVQTVQRDEHDEIISTTTTYEA